MIANLKFVQGAVSKKDFIPALKYFVIENGTVRGYNGTLALCSPLAFDLTCKPKADTLIRAIGNCSETVVLALTPGGRLSIKSGKFKALIDCIDGETPHVTPDGEPLAFDGVALLTALKAVAPFIGDDASRPWTNGVLLKGESAFATNNVSLVEYWHGSTFPTINVPRDAVKEMMRINEPPVSAQLTDTAITFHYTEGRWLRTQLFSTEWPDLAQILNKAHDAKPLDPELFVALEAVKPFVDKMGRIIFREGGVCTHTDDVEGAGYDIPGWMNAGIYRLEILKLLDGTAKTIDWKSYPSPCLFFGDKLRGALVGMRP